MEKDMLGLYITGHPLDAIESQIKENVTVYSYDFEVSEENNEQSRLTDNQFVRIAGIIVDIFFNLTLKGIKRMTCYIKPQHILFHGEKKLGVIFQHLRPFDCNDIVIPARRCFKKRHLTRKHGFPLYGHSFKYFLK
jgi:hypothetical protein